MTTGGSARTGEDLSKILRRIDGRGYKAYREIRGGFEFGTHSLWVDHVQGDPFAAPSRLRLRVPMRLAGLPETLRSSPVRRLALADFLSRAARRAVRALRTDVRAGSGKSGQISIDAGGQEVLERSAVVIRDQWVEARVEVGLPAAGRRVLADAAERLLCSDLASIASHSLLWRNISAESARDFVLCVENQESIRSRLDELDLVAFVGDDSILPRASGVSELPMPAENARPFRAPPSLRVSMPLANPIDGPEGVRRSIRGMGIRKGVTLVVGGGYHGKSTLLRALECCVYPHVPGDGREWVVAAPNRVKIRAEDGRAVTGVDISRFIGELPSVAGPGRGAASRATDAFSSEDASGSTSQAANIAEALEAGAGGLLLDEDTCATNFMLRDARMQELVARDHEPITPLVDRVRELYEQDGVSSVLVMGGCGDYFDVADCVIMMKEFEPSDVTLEARRIAARNPSGRRDEGGRSARAIARRVPLARSFAVRRSDAPPKIRVKARDLVLYDREAIDLRAVEQLLDTSQNRAVALAIQWARERITPLTRKQAHLPLTLRELLRAIERFLDEEGIDALDPTRRRLGDERHPGNLARPRRFEIAAAINRLRRLEIVQQRDRARAPSRSSIT